VAYWPLEAEHLLSTVRQLLNGIASESLPIVGLNQNSSQVCIGKCKRMLGSLELHFLAAPSRTTQLADKA
jgi:hypothetical protein